MSREFSARYTPLETKDGDCRSLSHPPVPRTSLRRRWFVVLILVFCGFGSYLGLRLWWATNTSDCRDTIDEGYQCAQDISRHWGQYSPYFRVPESEFPSEIPGNCQVTFVNMLSRHGARFPTPHKTRLYNATVAKIQSKVPDQTLQDKYLFLKDYKYRLGEAELVEFGRQQMINSGIKFFRRYSILSRGNTPFVRTASKQRVIDSADSWSRGFHSAKSALVKDSSYPYGRVILWEGEEFNNTLDHSRCYELEHGAFSKVGSQSQKQFMEVFTPPIVERLNRDLPWANISPRDAINLMQMCPFDTVADPSGRPSPFCGLFSADEFRQLSYYETLDKFYQYGNGNPLGPTQGVGFVNELLARMTETPVKDETSTNRTLDKSEKTFPLDRALYADFSHDNDLAAIFSALGLYDETPMLSKTEVTDEDATSGFSASWVVPFGSRAYFEKMKCSDGPNQNEELVRVVINDRVVPLRGCDADALGRCTLAAFAKSQEFAQSNGRWDECFPA